MASSQVGFGQQYIATPCANLVALVIPEADILSFVAAERHNYSFPAFPLFQGAAVTDMSFCNVTLSLRHTGADDTVWVNAWLPLKDWNGRYQATGGGGLAAGFGDAILAGQVGNGYAASTTDGGPTLDHTIDPQSGVWALKAEALQLNLAWRSIHDMAVVSKDAIKQFYGSEPHFSYWHGCSQGGRQGYAAAAKYPHDFDGILATVPAIDLPQIIVSE
jgi:feruloyl esterase